MSGKGPAALLAAWIVHDIEEALAFPAICDRLADRAGVERFRITPQQSWIAVGLMGIVVAAACGRGVRTAGTSTLYRAVTAGLEAHVVTHLGASVAHRGYTAGVATAVPIMMPGALVARRELRRDGHALRFRDTVNGIALLLPAAVACQAAARSFTARAGTRPVGQSARR